MFTCFMSYIYSTTSSRVGASPYSPGTVDITTLNSSGSNGRLGLHQQGTGQRDASYRHAMRTLSCQLAQAPGVERGVTINDFSLCYAVLAVDQPVLPNGVTYATQLVPIRSRKSYEMTLCECANWPPRRPNVTTRGGRRRGH
jgi:hypothetical protein